MQYSNYTEVQKFSLALKLSILISSIATLSILLFFYYRQIFYSIPFGNNPVSNTSFTILIFCMILFFIVLNALFYKLYFFLEVNNEGIHYKLFPFHLRVKSIAWSQIKSINIIKYNAFMDYGGYGIRLGRKGKAYILNGNYGLQLEIINKRIKLLLGTNKPKELEEYLRNINKI